MSDVDIDTSVTVVHWVSGGAGLKIDGITVPSGVIVVSEEWLLSVSAV